MILRGKPVVKTELFIETIPNTLQRNAKEFLVKICPRYTEYKIQSKKGKLSHESLGKIKFQLILSKDKAVLFKRIYDLFSFVESRITITIDERYQRTEQTVLQLNSNLTSDTCLSTRVNISVIYFSANNS